MAMRWRDYAKIGFWQNLKTIYVWTVRLNSILAQNPLVRKRVETFQSVKTLIKLPARCVALKRFNRHKNRSMSSACPTCDICRLVAMHIYRRIHMRVETIQQAHKRRALSSQSICWDIYHSHKPMSSSRQHHATKPIGLTCGHSYAPSLLTS